MCQNGEFNVFSVLLCIDRSLRIRRADTKGGLSVRVETIRWWVGAVVLVVAALMALVICWPHPGPNDALAGRDGGTGERPASPPASATPSARGHVDASGTTKPRSASPARAGITDVGAWRCSPLSPVEDGPRWRAERCLRSRDAATQVVIVDTSGVRGGSPLSATMVEAARRASGVDGYVTIAACSAAGAGADEGQAWRRCLARLRPGRGRWLVVAAGDDATRLLRAAQRGRLPTTLVALSPGAGAPTPHRDLASSVVVLEPSASMAGSAALGWQPLGARLVPTAGDAVQPGDLAGWLQALLAR